MNFGFYIIGDEILSGRRRDRHLARVIELLTARGHRLNWVSVLGDDLPLLVSRFRQTLGNGEPVLASGGIGATPDDLTRQAVAQALAVPLQAHPDGLRILEQKYGDELTAARRRMVEFPSGATLIPNPVNQVPGFSVAGHHFVPGFVEMAWPMLEWVLDEYYSASGQARLERALRIFNVYESVLIPVMERTTKDFPSVKVFSLPDIGDNQRRVELGVSGPPQQVTLAFDLMQQELRRLNLEFAVIDMVA